MKNSVKRVISVILVVLILSTSMFGVSSAAVATGKINYVVHNGALTVVGFTLDESSIGQTGALTIPDKESGYTVNAVADYAFKDRDYLTGLNLPYTITSIGAGFLSGCTNIKEFTVPANVRTLGSETEGAFKGSSVETVGFHSNTNAIPANAFADCTTLKEVHIPLNVKTIGLNAFANINSLTDIYYDGTLEQWNNIDIASGNDVLKSDKVTLHTSSAVSVTIHYKGETSGIYVSGVDLNVGSSGTGSLVIPSSEQGYPVIGILDEALKNKTFLYGVKMADSITTIGHSFISGCNLIEDITFPKNISKLGSDTIGALNGSYVKKVIFADGTIKIADNALLDADMVNTVVVPESVTSIGKNVFNNLKDTVDVYYYGSEAEWNKIAIRSDNNDLNTDKIIMHFNYDPNAKKSVYKYNDGELIVYEFGDENGEYDWDKYVNQIKYISIEDCITEIPQRAFSACRGLKEVTLGKDVLKVGSSAFANCNELEIVSFNSNPQLGSNLFSSKAEKNLTISCYSDAKNIIKYAENNKINCIKIEYNESKNQLSFYGDILISEDRDCRYVRDAMYRYPDFKEMYFTKIKYEGQEPEYDKMFFEIDLDGNVVSGDVLDNQRTNMYIRIVANEGGKERNISFKELFTVNELSSAYEEYTVYLDITSDEKKEEKVTIFQKIANFFTSAAKSLSRILNAIFKRKK